MRVVAAKRLHLTRPVVSEGQLAKTVASLLEKVVLSPAVWTHFPAGLGKLPPRTVGRAKAMGLKAGMPDYLVWHDGRTIGVELKRENGVLSDAQKEMHPKLLAAGVPVYVCRSAEDVIEALDIYDIPMRRNFVEAILRERRERHGDSKATGSGAAEPSQGARSPAAALDA